MRFKALDAYSAAPRRAFEGLLGALAEEGAARIHWAVVLFGSGIAVYFALPGELPTAFPVIALLSLLALYPVLRKTAGLRFLVVAGMLLLLGLSLASLRAASLAGPLIRAETGAVALSGKLVRIEERRGGALRLTIEDPLIEGLSPDETPGRVRITVRTRAEGLYPGAMVATRAVLLPLAGPVMPGGFDFARQTWFKGIGASGFSVAAVRITEAARPAGFWLRLEGLRLRVAANIRSHLPEPTASVAAALLTGIRGGIPVEVEENLRRAGLAHLLAISGLHMALLVGTSYFLIRALMAAIPPLAGRFPIKKWAAATSWFFGLGYLLLSGLALPTQRAFLMVSIIILAVLLERRAISMRLVAIAAAVILILEPEALLSPGFQMSFSAVIGLIAVYKLLRPWLYANRGRGRGGGWRVVRGLRLYFLGIIISTIIAELTIGPFAAFHFNRVALLGLPSNLVAIPVMGFWVMPAGLLALVLMPFGLEGPALAVMGSGIEVILSTAAEVSSLSFAALALPQMPLLSLVLFALGGLWLALWQNGRLRSASALFITAALILWIVEKPPDVLIGRDGRLVAIREQTSGLYYFSSGTAERFSRQFWQRALAQEEYLNFRDWKRLGGPADLGEGQEGYREAPRLLCRAEGCIYRLPASPGEDRPRTLAMTLQPAGFRLDCRQADILISRFRAPRSCKPRELLLDGPFMRNAGGAALWFRDGRTRLVTTNSKRGKRPWVIIEERRRR